MHEEALILLLKKLAFEADRVIGKLDRTAINGPINWGALECVETTYSISSRGEKRYTVYIEEAAPDAVELCQAVRAGLLAVGWPDNLTVSCEW